MTIIYEEGKYLLHVDCEIIGYKWIDAICMPIEVLVLN